MTRHEPISSAANPRVQEAARLREAACRRASGLTLVDGLREIGRAVASGVEIPEAFLDADAAVDPDRDALVATLESRGTRLFTLARRPFEKIAFGSRNEGLVAVARFHARSLADFKAAADHPVLVIEGVEKPGNLGAILRTCDAAGIAGVIACGSGTDPANPAAIRASLGTVFALPLAVTSTAEALAWCARERRRVVAAMPTGARLWHEADLTGRVAIVLGSEAEGLSSDWQREATAAEIAFESIRLPMQGIADSLNVAATAAVLTYESLRQQQRDARSL